MKKTIIAGVLSLTASSSLMAASYSVDIQNLTHGSYYTPLLVSAHPADIKLFESGMPASTNLQMMAEGGDIGGLDMDTAAVGAMNITNPAQGLLAPGASTTAFLGDPGVNNTQLSIVAMLLPTNDAFVALNNLTLPTVPGTYSYWLNAYDAGTEGNDEIRGGGAPGAAGMPVPPPLESLIGTGGSGLNAVAEGFVHIHRGVLGDHMATAGVSDINAMTQRWLNPVARIIITVE